MKKTSGKKIILPLSGGLDSRTIAAALKDQSNVVVVSYEFKNGIKETEYAKRIAKVYGWDFHPFTIPDGYLWNKLDNLSEINRCETEFTHPRQMSYIDQISELGDIIFLGHLGDALFSSHGNNKLSINEQTNYIINNYTKPGGLELAKDLWTHWKLSGDFEEKLFQKVKELLLKIKINNPSSRIRAFKSIYWVSRWTNPNLKVFSNYSEIFLPYYDSMICEFICRTPEEYLSQRKIQIEYIKSQAPELSEIPWQAYDLDLNKFKYFNSIYFPRRIIRYIRRKVNENLFNSASLIERNWELQFLGEENDRNLKRFLFDNHSLHQLVPKKIIKEYYYKFINIDKVKYSHPISMLLTLSYWLKNHWKN